MPLGAMVGGAVIGGVATVGSGMMAADAQSDAAQTAADSSYAVAQLNNDLYRDIRAENMGVLGPYAAGGLPAMYMMNDLLGISSYPMPAAATPATGTPTTGAPATGGGALNGYTPGSGPRVSLFSPTGIGRVRTALQGSSLPAGADPTSPAVRAGYLGPDMAQQAGTPAATTNAVRPRLSDFRGDPQGFRDARQDFRENRAGTGTPAAGGASGSGGALDAFARFRQGTNYQWRLNEGMDALNSKHAALGHFESGAADKALVEFGQNFASNELARYMDLLAGQQSMGLNAAGAIAGQGMQYVNGVTAQNTNAANAAANAALVAGQGQAGMWGAVGQGVGAIGGALSQYGMGRLPQATYAPAQPMPGGMSDGSNYLYGNPWDGGW